LRIFSTKSSELIYAEAIAPFANSNLLFAVNHKKLLCGFFIHLPPEKEEETTLRDTSSSINTKPTPPRKEEQNNPEKRMGSCCFLRILLPSLLQTSKNPRKSQMPQKQSCDASVFKYQTGFDGV